MGTLTEQQRLRRRLEDALRDRGLNETVSYSFTSPAALARLRLDGEPALRLENPLTEDQSVMRPLLLPGLLDAAAHNAAYGRDELALFESARAFRPSGSLDAAPSDSPEGDTPAEERHHRRRLLTVGQPAGWRTPGRAADYYSARAVLDALLETAGVGLARRARRASRSCIRAARPRCTPAAARSSGSSASSTPRWPRPGSWRARWPCFELDLDALGGAGARVYRDVTSVPAVRQDIAVVVPEDVPAARVEAAVREGGGDLLESLRIFDLYRGEQVGEGSKSLALRLEFRAPDRTLTDEEVAERRVAIEREIEKLGGALRV